MDVLVESDYDRFPMDAALSAALAGKPLAARQRQTRDCLPTCRKSTVRSTGITCK
jgi:hypothetical protein